MIHKIFIVSISCFFIATAMQPQGTQISGLQPPTETISQPAATASQPAAQNEPHAFFEVRDMYIINRTDWKLVLQYVRKNLNGPTEPPLEKTIVPQGFFVFRNYKEDDYEFIKILPSGKYWGKTQHTAPTNLVNIISKAIQAKIVENLLSKKNEVMDGQVLITTSKRFADSIMPYVGTFVSGLVGRFEEIIESFKYEVLFDKNLQRPLMPNRLFINQAFPGIEYDVAKGLQVKLRHYLGVPEHASVRSIDKAYEELVFEWQKEKEKRPEQMEFIDKVLSLLKRAHDALREGTELKDYMLTDIEGMKEREKEQRQH